MPNKYGLDKDGGISISKNSFTLTPFFIASKKSVPSDLQPFQHLADGSLSPSIHPSHSCVLGS